jgi:hypothetical protein
LSGYLPVVKIEWDTELSGYLPVIKIEWDIKLSGYLLIKIEWDTELSGPLLIKIEHDVSHPQFVVKVTSSCVIEIHVVPLLYQFIIL